MFTIWIHFKGEYWIIENMCLKIWYMPLKPAIDIHNIWMFPFAKPPIGLILHTCICIHLSITSKKKTGLNCESMTCPTGGAPNINYGQKYIWKNRSICPSPLISQEKSIMEIIATQELWKKKGSDHFRDILNPYGEKSNYGKIGRRRRLSKLNVLFFFSIILSVTITIYYGGSHLLNKWFTNHDWGCIGDVSYNNI